MFLIILAKVKILNVMDQEKVENQQAPQGDLFKVQP